MRFDGSGCFKGSSQLPAASTHLYISERYCSHVSRMTGVGAFRFANGTSPDRSGQNALHRSLERVPGKRSYFLFEWFEYQIMKMSRRGFSDFERSPEGKSAVSAALVLALNSLAVGRELKAA